MARNCINLSVLTDSFDEETCNMLLIMGMDTIEKNLILINNGIEIKKQEKIFRGAHSIKGLASIGMTTIVEHAEEICQETRNKNYEDIDIKKIKNLYKKLEQDNKDFQEWLEDRNLI